MGTKKQLVKQPADTKSEKASAAAGADGVVVSRNLEKFSLVRLPVVRKLPYRLRLPVLVLLIAVVFLGMTLAAHYLITRPRDGHVMSEQAASAQKLTSLQKNSPEKDASTTAKVKYYEDLSQTKADTGDYKGAVEAFKQREAISSTGITYVQYANLAVYYYLAKDTAGALSALAQADKAVDLQYPSTTQSADAKSAHDAVQYQREQYKK